MLSPQPAKRLNPPIPIICSTPPFMLMIEFAQYCNKPTHLLALTNNLGDCMSYHDTRLLCLLLGQSARDANFEGGSGLPAGVSGVEAEADGEGLEAGDEDAVGETLCVGLRVSE